MPSFLHLFFCHPHSSLGQWGWLCSYESTKLRGIKEVERPGTLAHTSDPNTLGGQGGRIT